jgi:hypothetical protein
MKGRNNKGRKERGGEGEGERERERERERPRGYSPQI